MNILSLVGQTGAVTGDWYQVETNRTHVPITVSITSGTATVVLEGRVAGNDTPVVINTLSASDGFNGMAFTQIRARVSAAAAATVVVSVGARLIDTVP